MTGSSRGIKIETKPWAILLVIITTLFSSTGSLLFKVGMNRFGWSIEGVLAAYPVIIGGIVYFMGFILLTYSYRHGELSVLFPFISLSFIWVTLLSWLVLGEIITLAEILGVAAIVCGVVLIGLSSRTNKKKLRLRG
ncbi:TPA: EamA family transporter [Candidatus Woesearchaeota archaeon]|nr:EamA family transporter [Candidatus Woesearchaeota archaeon]